MRKKTSEEQGFANADDLLVSIFGKHSADDRDSITGEAVRA